MPTINITLTISNRVASLNKDAAERELSATLTNAEVLTWFIQKVKRQAVAVAIQEFNSQADDSNDSDRAAIESEVTT